MSKTFKILYDSYFPFIAFPIGMGVVWLLFDMPINIGALLGINLGYIYGFFNYRFSYIDKICIENDILHIVSINRFLQKNSGQFEIKKISNVKIYYIKWYRATGRIEFNIDDEHKSYKFFKTEQEMLLRTQLKDS